MGFVKTREELDKYYGLGVRRFSDARMLGVMFSTRPEVSERLLPPPLEQADLPGGLIFIAEYPKTNLGPGYREAALFMRCKYQGEAGSYCLSMPIDNEARMHNGRDVFGFPRRLARKSHSCAQTSVKKQTSATKTSIAIPQNLNVASVPSCPARKPVSGEPRVPPPSTAST